MEKLNYDVIKKVGYDGYLLKEAPEKVMQFGEGNFLREEQRIKEFSKI